MTVLLYTGITLLTVVAMEFVAWFTHKYVMHGFLWYLHEDHHKPDEHPDSFFEKNDTFFLVFAIPSASCYLIGSLYADYRWALFVGIGISIYGLIYFLIHDVYIHRRFNWFKQLDSRYSRAILRAHGAHHSKREKEDGESFGLLVVSSKYFKKRSEWARESQQVKESNVS